MSFRKLWNSYWIEACFLIILSVILALSTYISHFIPDELYDNTITPIFITATVVTAFVCVVLIHRYHGGIRARKLFGLALAVWGLSDLVYLIGWAVAPKQVMDMGAVELTNYELLLGNLLGWMMLLYPTEMLRPGWLTWKTVIWQLVPLFALVGLDYIIPYNLSPIIACYPYALLVVLSTHMRAYQLWCEENFSTLDDIDVRWIVRYCIILLMIGGNYVYICYSHDHARGFTQQWFVVFMMMYCTEQILTHKDPWQDVRKDDAQYAKTGVYTGRGSAVVTAERSYSGSNERHNSTREQQLQQWMEEQKPYLNPDFQLMDLRAVLPMNRTYLSQFINDTYSCSFYQFVNRNRIEEAQRLIRECPEMRLADVATRSGFSSREAFARTFTQMTGLSPREWGKKCNNP